MAVSGDHGIEINDLPVVAWLPQARREGEQTQRSRKAPVAPAEVAATVSSLGQAVAHTGSAVRLERQHDRGRIARDLLIIYGVLLLVLLLLVGLHRISVGEALQLVNGLGTPIVGLLGACVGYYFGRKATSR